MYESKFTDYWTQAQFCYFKAEAAKGPAAKLLWIHLAQDWIALAETSLPELNQKNNYVPQEELEPILVA
jgi:hypothetical protein